MSWIIGGSLLGLAVVAVATWLVMGSLDKGNTSDVDASTVFSTEPDTPPPLAEDQITPDEKRFKKDIADALEAQTGFLDDGCAVFEKFLAAKSTAELESLVRTPEVTVPRMRAWYATHERKPQAAKEMPYGGGVSVQGFIGIMLVRLDDYSVQSAALEKTPEGYLVDWESWVAWCSMDWHELFEKRPTEPVEVRVRCSLGNYYNRQFDDDRKWLSVRLIHPSSERTIYGYIARDATSLIRSLTNFENRDQSFFTLKIHYPENAVADNQVIISECVQTGWVRQGDAGSAENKTLSPNTSDE
ncbi:MAG: hypothetical protein KJO21_07295 [Verrucomicrobiae bacterium]|nr:hypothetical protein [Verrucomicrobiae bacterium]NNJ43279.1 hypothetical protein [Akkermansiaceae bacterium]